MAQKVDNIAVMYRIMSALTDGEQTDTALNNGLEELTRVLFCEDATLWLANNEEKRIYAVAHYGENTVTGYSIEFGERVFSRMNLWTSIRMLL